MSELSVKIDDISTVSAIFGNLDENIKIIESALEVSIASDTEDGAPVIRISGSDGSAHTAAETVKLLCRIASFNGTVTERDVRYSLSVAKEAKADETSRPEGHVIFTTHRGTPITTRTAGQKRYTDAIENSTVIFGIGPAGTGKTFLAVAMAVKALRSKAVGRIVITRPAVEAGERLGFLPGDLQSKIDPYIRPIYDALYEILGAENSQRYMEKGIIEIAPLAYMRGRTLDDCFIILDEAQNTSREQMKMFLTRLGRNSKAIVTGDLTQTDLPAGTRSGLKEAVKILEGIEGISIHRFTDRDVVRHHIVQKIILAYEKSEGAQK